MGQPAPRQRLAPPPAPPLPCPQPRTVVGSGLAATSVASCTRRLDKQLLGGPSTMVSLPDRVTALEVEVVVLWRELAACRSELASLKVGGTTPPEVEAPPVAPPGLECHPAPARRPPAQQPTLATHAPVAALVCTLPGLPAPAPRDAPPSASSPGIRCPLRQRLAAQKRWAPAGNTATAPVTHSRAPTSHTMLVHIPASAAGRPSLASVRAALRAQEADYCGHLACRPAQHEALWDDTVGEAWWVDASTVAFAVSSKENCHYLLYCLNQDCRHSAYHPQAALSQQELGRWHSVQRACQAAGTWVLLLGNRALIGTDLARTQPRVLLDLVVARTPAVC